MRLSEDSPQYGRHPHRLPQQSLRPLHLPRPAGARRGNDPRNHHGGTEKIICKTQKHAAALHRKLKSHHENIHLLDSASTIYDAGIILATAHLVKGLEFDEVIIPDVDADNYRTSIDRQMLYVACTRAMHTLRLCHTGQPCLFLAASAKGTVV